MAVSQKRLFWISIIIVELVLLYVVWGPFRNRFIRPSHRSAFPAPVLRPPEAKPSAVVIPSGRPPKARRSNVTVRPLIVHASLKEPEPIPAVPVSVVPQTSLSPPGTFWCDLANITLNCDCRAKGDERANNLAP
jgi:hypothetical protein